MINWRAGAVRRSCTNPLNARANGHNNPIALSTTTQVEVTLLSAVGDDCTTLAAPLDSTRREKQLRWNHPYWLMRMAAERGLRRPVTSQAKSEEIIQKPQWGYMNLVTQSKINLHTGKTRQKENCLPFDVQLKYQRSDLCASSLENIQHFLLEILPLLFLLPNKLDGLSSAVLLRSIVLIPHQKDVSL